MATFHLGSIVDPIKTLEFWQDNLDCFEHLRDAGQTTEYLARCPAHYPDEHPSLVVIHDPANKEWPVRCHCRAGRDDCTFSNIVSLLKKRAIAQAIGPDEGAGDVTPSLTPQLQTSYQPSWIETVQHSPLALYAGYTGVSYAWLKDHPTLTLAEDMAGGWVYHVFDSVEGERPGLVLKGRKMPPTGDKKADRIWKNLHNPAPPFWPVPPQELPEEFVTTEGESDCLLARYWGFEAYSLTNGAGTPLDEEIVEELYRRGVRRWVIFADTDHAGQTGRNTIVRLCLDVGIIPVPVNLRLLTDVMKGGHKDLRDCRHLFADPDTAHKAIRGIIQQAEEQLDRVIPAFEDAYAQRTHEDEWLVEDVIAPGCISMIVAKPGVGKTTVLMAYAAAAREGTPLLDWSVRPHRILFATEEGTRSLWKKREIFGAMPHVRLHSVDFEGLDEDWSEQVRIIGDVARRHHCDVIVVDTLFSFASPEDEDKSAKVRPVFKKLRALTRQGFAVLVTMHGRKSGGSGVDVISGSIVIPGEADIALELAPAPDGEAAHRQVSWIKNRMNPDVVSLPSLSITVDGDHLVLLDDGTGSQDRERRLLDLLDDHEWHTSDEIASSLSCTQDQLRRSLESVCRKNGVLKEKCNGHNGKRGTYRYRLERPMDLSGLNIK
jgi:KaiC/GvpD/RAD55 family RecA-like ATPase